MSVLHWIAEELSVAMDCKSLILSDFWIFKINTLIGWILKIASSIALVFYNALSNIVLATCFAVY